MKVTNTYKGFQFDEQKYKELILYIAERTLNDSGFGATKMAKTLLKADFVSFALYGKPITGAKYQKIEHGPAAVQYLPILNKMIQRKEVAQAQKTIGGYSSTQIVALKKANISVFTKEEIALIDNIILEFSNLNTHGVKKIVYDNLGIKYAGYKDEIPYLTELIPSESIPLSEKEMEWAISSDNYTEIEA